MREWASTVQDQPGSQPLVEETLKLKNSLTMSSGERNNNVPFTSLTLEENVITAPAVSASKLAVVLTPKILKIIIAILATGIITGITFITTMIIINVLAKQKIEAATPTSSTTEVSTFTTHVTSVSTLASSPSSPSVSTISSFPFSSSPDFNLSSSSESPTTFMTTSTLEENTTAPSFTTPSTEFASSSTVEAYNTTIIDNTTLKEIATTTAIAYNTTLEENATTTSSTSLSSTLFSTSTLEINSTTITDNTTFQNTTAASSPSPTSTFVITSPIEINTTSTTATTTFKVCSLDQFLCGSGECIPWKHLCDGYPQCKDASDEGDSCVCGIEQWRCASGQCIPTEARCDHVNDCMDYSDESVCPDCSGFQCDSGLCLWDGSQGRCNGVFECSDFSDEIGCPIIRGNYMCNNTVQIQQSKRCNGIDDCGDNSDETYCKTSCKLGQFACLDGWCIPRAWRCDGHTDCSDGTDELECASCLPDQYTCENLKCINKSAICDGVRDCKTEDDELHCFSIGGTEETGLLSVRYQEKDLYVCSDVWSLSLAEQICSDMNQLHLSTWEDVKPQDKTAEFAVFKDITAGASTTNIEIRNHCFSGHIISISCQKQECGERQVPFLQSFVAGGQIVAPGKWPWAASLMYLGQVICGGSLIASQWVVTAAHCILSSTKGNYNFTSTPYYYDVIVGSTHSKGQTRIGTPYRVRVQKIHLFPNHIRSIYGTVDWDLALLKLSVPLQFGDYIQPLCLPHPLQEFTSSSLCYLTGWGLINEHQLLGVEELRDTRMQLWNDQRCSKDTVPGEITVNINSTMCAGFTFGRPTGCQGDSGGPLMCYAQSGHWILAGIMSRGSSPCGVYQPGLRANRFARITTTLNWIKQHLGES